MLLGQRDELQQRLRRDARVEDEYERIAEQLSDRYEVALGVVGQLRICRSKDGERPGDHQQRLTVRGGLGNGVGADYASGTGLVLDNYGLLQSAFEMGLDQPRRDVV